MQQSTVAQNPVEARTAAERWNERMVDGLCVLLLLVLTILFNYSERMIAVAFYDDLGTWQDTATQGFLAEALNLSAFKIRPIAMGMIWLLVHLGGMQPAVMGMELLVLHGLGAVCVFLMAKRLSGHRGVAFGMAALFQASRFAYYQVTQVLGVMEAVALLLAIGMLYALAGYVRQPNAREYWLAWGLYLLVMFTHERYMFLLPVLLLAALLSTETKKKKIIKMLAAIAAFAAFLLLRYCLFGQNMWMGTGGTSIASGFNLKNSFIFALDQVGYLFGFNMGEAYLSGVMVENTPRKILCAAILMDVCALGYCLAATTGTPKKRRPELWKTVAVFLMFIAMCIGSSSTTIRVEMRWIYVSFAGMLLLAAALWKTAWRSGGRWRRIALCLLLGGYILSGLYVECSYRPFWHNMYYYGLMADTNAFDAATWQKYGNSLFTDIERIVVLDNDPNFWDEKKEFLSECLACHTDTCDIGALTIEQVNLLEDMPTDAPQKTIYLVREGNEYTDLTKYYRLYDEPGIVTLSGMEPDGWTHQTTELQIRPRHQGTFHFMFYTNSTPDETWANRTGRIYVDDELVSSYLMDGQLLAFDISLPFDHSSNVRIENDWTDASIKRGDNELCFVLSVQELE